MVRDLAAAVTAALGAPFLCVCALGAHSPRSTLNTAQEPRIVVPEATSARVVTDGHFLPGEWEGAYQGRVSENFDVYLLADSANLYIGFRFHREVEATFGAELYVAVDDKEFLNLHSTGALGEGINRFSPDLRAPAFTVGAGTGWESNVAKRPVRSQGKEFKIDRRKLAGASVRVAAVMMAASSDLRETADFPGRFGFVGTDGWVELVLPSGEQ